MAAAAALELASGLGSESGRVLQHETQTEPAEIGPSIASGMTIPVHPIEAYFRYTVGSNALP